jgi:hypothetical protein
MKTVTDKYLEMNHNYIELHDSIVQKVKDEKPIENGLLNDVFIAMGVLNHFLDVYKETNEVKTKVKEDDEFVEGDVYYPNVLNKKRGAFVDKSKHEFEEGVIYNPNAWK